MRLRTSLTFWSATFFSTLGLSPMVACGGVMRNDGEGMGGQGSDPTATGGYGTGGTARETGGYGNGGYISEMGGYGTGGYIYEMGGQAGMGTGGASTGGANGGWPPCIATATPGGSTPYGFAECVGGSIHRTARYDCPAVAPASCTPYNYGGDAGVPYGQCVTNADCNAAPNGYCGSSGYYGGAPGCYCTYGCRADADCAAGQLCLCGSPGLPGQCVEATCGTDSDCAPGALCLSYVQSPGCGGTGFACQAPFDQCVSDADCANGPDGASAQCTVQNGNHVCQTPMCAIGRPFLVEGSARTAEIARRRDWSSNLCPVVDGLGSAVRADLATHWTEVALMEHASIAAFARFALEIMSLGAPPELLVATHSAMADETAHARDAFALASAYAGHAVGPGALDVGAALLGRTPLDIVKTAILEGCIGETVAAVEAAEALAHATDPAVRAALERVVVDETKHAELAWQFVKWVLEHGDARLAQDAATCLVTVVESELAAGGNRVSAPSAGSDEALRTHGALDAATRSEIRRRVVTDVIAPCARALTFQSRRNKNLNDPSLTVAA